MKQRDTSGYDVIKIVGLTTTGHHGVYSFERRDGQQFTVDVIMYVDTRGAADDDDLDLTVDYSEVAADVNAVLAGPPVFLLETLAQNIAEVVLAYDAVQIVEVVVHKPNAPINYKFTDVTMTIRRSRSELASESGPRAPKPRASTSSVEATLPGSALGAADPDTALIEEVGLVAEPAGSAEDVDSIAEAERETESAGASAPIPPALTRSRSARHARTAPAKHFEEPARDRDLDAPAPQTAPADEASASTRENEPRVRSDFGEAAKHEDAVSSPVHEAMWRRAEREAQRKEWLAKHQEELARAVEDPAATPIARSMTGWRTGDPRPKPPRFKRPVTSPESPLHAVLAKSFVSRSDLEETPTEPVAAIIALGANMGKPWKTLAEAIVTLDAMPDTSVTGVSALFRTGAILAPDQAPQDDYYNAVVEVRTKLSAIDLLNGTQMIENAFGRVRTEHWGPRTLDLDIITYSTLRSDDPQLTLPHPRAHERAFVLVPWLQVDPNAHVGRFGRADVLVADLADQPIVEVASTWVEDAISGNDELFSGQPKAATPEPLRARPPRRTRRAEVTRRSIRNRSVAPEEYADTPAAGTSFAATLGEETRSERRRGKRKRPRWVPLPRVANEQEPAGAQPSEPGGRPEGQPAQPDSAQPSDTQPDGAHASSPGEATSDIPLPNWRKRQPRIVDDATELHRGGSSERPHARVEPGLADDFATGLLPVTDLKRPSRRTVVRPTVTGTIPIVRPNDEDDTP